jgi:peroxiredoxin
MTLQETLASIAKSGLPLQGKLDALKFEFDNNLAPPAAVEVLHRATDELIASGAQSRALKAGDVAPEFTLPDPDGNPVSSKVLLAKGPLVVTFYRGAWCPFCNFDLSALEEARSEIESRGATLVAISQQTAPNSRKSQRQNGLGFPILGDHGGEIAAQFGVRWTLPDYLREVQKALGADLTQFNGEDSWTLPMPARYVIAQDGTIAYAEVNADYTRRPEPSAIFPVLEQLGRRAWERRAVKPIRVGNAPGWQPDYGAAEFFRRRDCRSGHPRAWGVGG